LQIDIEVLTSELKVRDRELKKTKEENQSLEKLVTEYKKMARPVEKSDMVGIPLLSFLLVTFI